MPRTANATVLLECVLCATSLEGETSLQTYACMTNQTLHVLVTTVKWQVTSLLITTSYITKTDVVTTCRALH